MGLFDKAVEQEEVSSLICNIFSKDLLKVLYYHACRIDIEDNNDKAEMIAEILGSEFQELGTGTNRMAFLYTPNEDREFRGGAGLVYKIALDRRGYQDNWTEFKRSAEIPQYAIKAYECNLLILVEEYVNLMDADEFRLNENGIKEILENLSTEYVFEDIGFDMKNYENYGYRENGDIVILDIGYVYPIRNNEKALSCPKCSGQLKYNSNYTGFVCQNKQCKTKFTFLDVRRQMNQELENLEDRMLLEARNCEAPDFDRLNVI